MDKLNKNSQYKRVMVIDDTHVDRYIAQQNIRKCAFADEVILMESAGEAIAYLKSLPEKNDEIPQMIFLDICMPEKSGFDFLDEYDQLPESVKRHSIIIMLSTSLNTDDHDRAKNNKYVMKFMNKPLNTDKLKELRTQVDPKNKAA